MRYRLIQSNFFLVFCVFLFPFSVTFGDSIEFRFADGKEQLEPIEFLFTDDGKLNTSRLVNVKSLRFSTESDSPEDLCVMIQLTNGDLIFADQIVTVEDTMVITLFGQAISLPLEFVKEVTWETSLHTFQQTQLDRSEDDVVVLENGDHVKGEFIVLGADDLQIITELGPIKLPTDKLKTIAFNAQLSEKLESPRINYECYLSNGSVVTVDSILNLSDKKQFRIKLSDLYEVTVPHKELRRIEIWKDRYQRITSNYLVGNVEINYFGGVQTFEANLNADGQLLITSRKFSKSGFGVRSGSKLSFGIPAKAISLSGAIGLDARGIEAGGAVTAKILLDGEEIWQAKISRSKTQYQDLPSIPLEHNAPLGTFRKLEFVVEFDAAADVGDLVNWQGIYLEYPPRD